MKDKTITIKTKNINKKQYATLLLELNIVKKAWKPFGVDIQLSAPGLAKIINWGTRHYADNKANRRGSNPLE